MSFFPTTLDRLVTIRRRRLQLRRFARALRVAAHAQHGQALVEFALVLPILLALAFGITEFALALNTQGEETHIASEIARFAVVNQNPGEAESKSLAQWGIGQLHDKALQNGTKSEICVTFPAGEQEGDPVEVKVKSTVSWLPFPKLPKGFASTELVGSATMRLETAPTAYAPGCTQSKA